MRGSAPRTAHDEYRFQGRVSASGNPTSRDITHSFVSFYGSAHPDLLWMIKVESLPIVFHSNPIDVGFLWHFMEALINERYHCCN